jgi:hypothetical protein
MLVCIAQQLGTGAVWNFIFENFKKYAIELIKNKCFATFWLRIQATIYGWKI